jgi:hypothetical protein
MEKFTEDLNIIRSLPDNPALTSDEFRSKFDEAGKKIKEYINNILGPEVESKAGEAEMTLLSTNLNNKIDDSLAELERDVNKAISDLTTSVNGSLQSMNSAINSTNSTVSQKTTYADFLITRNSYQNQGNDYVVSTSDRNADLYHSVNQSGYYPIALIGVRGTSTDEKFDYRYGYLSNQTNGSCIAHWIFTNHDKGSFNANSLPACEVTVLWVKIR